MSGSSRPDASIEGHKAKTRHEKSVRILSIGVGRNFRGRVAFPTQHTGGEHHRVALCVDVPVVSTCAGCGWGAAAAAMASGAAAGRARTPHALFKRISEAASHAEPICPTQATAGRVATMALFIARKRGNEPRHAKTLAWHMQNAISGIIASLTCNKRGNGTGPFWPACVGRSATENLIASLTR